MITEEKTRQRLAELFPFLQTPSAEHEEFFRQATFATLPEGQTIAFPGEPCARFILILQGTLRVYRTTDSGREITLYRLSAGESCVLTAACIMSNQGFPALAETETAIEAVLIPATEARNWLTRWPAWCTFTFALVSQRLADVISMLEEVAFQRMNVRIAHYLLSLSGEQSETLHLTHQQIAADLGTSREVVSRILKSFEKTGLLQASRKSLRIIDRKRLQALS